MVVTTSETKYSAGIVAVLRRFTLPATLTDKQLMKLIFFWFSPASCATTELKLGSFTVFLQAPPVFAASLLQLFVDP